MHTKLDLREIAKDWGECHRVLDHLQLAVEHARLAPRLRILVDHLVAGAGWPTGAPPDPSRHPPALIPSRLFRWRSVKKNSSKNR